MRRRECILAGTCVRVSKPAKATGNRSDTWTGLASVNIEFSFHGRERLGQSKLPAEQRRARKDEGRHAGRQIWSEQRREGGFLDVKQPHQNLTQIYHWYMDREGERPTIRSRLGGLPLQHIRIAMLLYQLR